MSPESSPVARWASRTIVLSLIAALAAAALVAGGRATRFTEDHRLTNDAERNRIVEAGGEIWGPYVRLPDGPGIMPTRTLGDHEFARVGVLSEPAVSTHPLHPGFLVAACDGLWDVMGVEDLPKLLKGATTPEEAAGRLAHEALHVRSTTDNLTVLVVRILKGG